MTKRNRRQFLEDSMFATAAAVVASSSGRLLAQEEGKNTNPNDRLNVCVVGAGGRGPGHRLIARSESSEPRFRGR